VHAPVLETILLPPKPIKAAPRREPRPKPKPQPQPQQPAPPAPRPKAPAPAAAPPLATVPSGQSTAITGTGSEGTAAGGAASGPSAAPPAPPAPPAAEVLRFSVAPPATLHYASFVNGVKNTEAQIRWQHDGANYRLEVTLRMLWFRFAFVSSGVLGEHGLLPDRYEEARRSKKEAARFERPAGVLAFEANGRQVPLPDGVQDRFSVFLQLVGLVRGNPQRYARPGATETFTVADTRDLDGMQVQYVGDEDIDTGSGFVRAKHFVRLQRRADDRRRVEAWLAESLGWMPVKLRQTEPDGTQIDLVLRGADLPPH
jgi:hypothetical protein